MIGDVQEYSCGSNSREEEDGESFPLPGFRFHPTDEEIVAFYLSRKVQKKSFKIEIIKHVDIYKFDPWDLPRWSNTENESYFFCKRGRKYRNSIRPNRVTISGFWKATGIDKPIYSDTTKADRRQSPIIGLKKTLVYYRGSAGKGTKTDWMMHEFRLPTTNDSINATGGVFNHSDNSKSTSLEEAEVWTLCRIFKRNVSSRKYTPDWRELASNKRVKPHPTNTGASHSSRSEAYINFGDPSNSNVIPSCHDQKNVFDQHTHLEKNMSHMNQLSFMSHLHHQAPSTTTLSGTTTEFSNILEDSDHVFPYGNWDELRSVVEFALDPSSS